MALKGIKKSRKNRGVSSKSPAKREAEARAYRMTKKKSKTVKVTGRKSGERVAKGMPYRLKSLQAMQVRSLPETSLTKRGMSLRKLLRSTPPYFINKSKNVQIVNYAKKQTANGRPVVHAKVVTRDPMMLGKVKRVHECFVVGIDPVDDTIPINRQKKVLVQCSCLSGFSSVHTYDKGMQAIKDIAAPLGSKYMDYIVDGEVRNGTAPFVKGLQNTYNVQLSNGRTLKVTDDHRLLDSNGTWTTLKQMTNGTKLKRPLSSLGPVRIDTDAFVTGYVYSMVMNTKNMTSGGRAVINPKSTSIRVDQIRFVEPSKGKSYLVSPNLLSPFKSYTREDRAEFLAGFLNGAVECSGYVFDTVKFSCPVEIRQFITGLMFESGLNDFEVSFSGIRDEYSLYRMEGLDDIILSLSDSCILDTAPPISIKSVSFNKREMVYDIFIEDVHRFEAEGIIAHNCENFVYVFEYANAAHGASKLIYSNGQPPNFTNPALLAGCCKHLTAVAEYMIIKNI